jgi:stage III sporulation protein SpoIIIAA
MAATQLFSPRRVTDDLAQLLEVLPDGVRQALAGPDQQEGLLEVVLDLGRSPEARYPGRALMLGTRPIERSDLAEVVARLGAFGGDNRAGIERTLHRISAIRNRSGEVVGLTCRVGRAVFGTVAMVRDLLDSGESLLLLGRPGVGKTTALREIARVLADELERRVVVIDTSNEIAGDGDIPHPAIGRARRMQVARPELQHQVMIEAVENHMPEVIVIDEIGTELEARAARTIAERGVMLVATAHGNELANLIRNPTLADLVGGIQSVTLGDEEARRRGSQKAVLERRAEPTFPLAVEIRSRGRWLVHTDVAQTVDAQLRGQPARPQVRELDADGLLRLESPPPPGGAVPPRRRPVPSLRSALAPVPLPDPFLPPPHRCRHPQSSEERLRLFCCGVSDHLLDQAVRSRQWPVERVEVLEQAEGVLALRRQLGRDPQLRRLAQQLRLPILVIKADTLPQILRGVERLLRRSREPLSALRPFEAAGLRSGD